MPVLLALRATYRSVMQLRHIASVTRDLVAPEHPRETKWQLVGWETRYAKAGARTWIAVYRWPVWPALVLATPFIGIRATPISA